MLGFEGRAMMPFPQGLLWSRTSFASIEQLVKLLTLIRMTVLGGGWGYR